MGTFPSLSRSERAPHKITTAAVRAQDQFLSTVDAVVTSLALDIGRPRLSMTSLNIRSVLIGIDFGDATAIDTKVCSDVRLPIAANDHSFNV